jgi:hypothetical protein
VSGSAVTRVGFGSDRRAAHNSGNARRAGQGMGITSTCGKVDDFAGKQFVAEYDLLAAAER